MLKHRALWYYWANCAAGHVMPAAGELVVTDSATAASLIAHNPDYVDIKQSDSTQPTARYMPAAYRRLLDYDGSSGARASFSRPIIFLGTLRRPNGTERLLVISGYRAPRYNLTGSLQIQLFRIGLFDTPPSRLDVPLSINSEPITPRVSEWVEFRTGQIDPNDPSHLVIPFVILGGQILAAPQSNDRSKQTGEGSLDAYLDNEDSLRWKKNMPGPAPVR